MRISIVALALALALPAQAQPPEPRTPNQRHLLALREHMKSLYVDVADEDLCAGRVMLRENGEAQLIELTRCRSDEARRAAFARIVAAMPFPAPPLGAELEFTGTF
jgi:hypothetical protein